ncbi:MAG: hypothetical protein V9G08_03700 [Dermatophilaceae bacterium]
MKRCWMTLGAVVVSLTMAGCGDSKSKTAEKTPAAPPQQGAGNPLTAPVDYLGAVGAAQRQAAKTVDLTSLTQAVQAFQAGEERLPKSLQELVTEGYLPRLPAPPKGMQWAYQPQSGQVRVVPLPAAPTAPTAPTAPAAPATKAR